ncbi:putative Galactose oxidase, central domain [Monocercomonoides exilis]|uniref:putative Galactose oxidase, central domain n=1 Tax=Monocercomonoides exilis TaxID=2049356 RepID=UPI00355AB87F|nr:putative Galactose oxidase, central domain [Monocercomonoides exilis]|eukprot:MONOS_7886.1-p1 / transcript=MONOS_7886.1 / gene=MONOS_7886 / organism=Monocercomonoides_exilis_PA203 / gene_product=Galactose oxidase, central domain / transcript_product=Galactose oxidase, central domain / location=Mono_scaffold00282:9671-14340(+) / protein_length=1491 / sequence_SO=supercontig / SO=protein_coding / is_pseudo=false
MSPSLSGTIKKQNKRSDIVDIAKIVTSKGNPDWIRVKYVGEKPTPRIGQSFTLCGPVMIMFGGINQKTRMNDIWLFHTATTKWHRVVPDSISPLQRCGHSAVIQGADMLIFGGDNGETCMNDLHAFDLEHEKWTIVPITSSPAMLPAPRTRHAAISFGNKMLIFGGEDLYSGADDAEDRTTFSQNQTDMHKSTATKKGDEGKPHFFNDLYMFDTVSLKWLALPSRSEEVPCPRAGHSMTLVGSSIYVFGGFGDDQHLNDLWELNPLTLCWTKIEPAKKEKAAEEDQSDPSSGGFQYLSPRSLHSVAAASRTRRSGSDATCPSPRSGHSAFAVGDRLLIFGGYTVGAAKDDLWEFNTTTRIWTRLYRSRTSRNMGGTTSRSLAGSRGAKGGSGKSLAPGAQTVTFAPDGTEILKYPMPVARCEQIAFALTEHHILLFGGVGYESTIPRTDMWVLTLQSADGAQAEKDMNDLVSVTGLTLGEEDDEETAFIKSELKRLREELDQAEEDMKEIGAEMKELKADGTEDSLQTKETVKEAESSLEQLRLSLNLLRDFEMKRWGMQNAVNEELKKGTLQQDQKINEEMRLVNELAAQIRTLMKENEEKLKNREKEVYTAAKEKADNTQKRRLEQLEQIEAIEKEKMHEDEKKEKAEEEEAVTTINALAEEVKAIAESAVEEAVEENVSRGVERMKRKGENQLEKAAETQQKVDAAEDERAAVLREKMETVRNGVEELMKKENELGEESSQKAKEQKKQLEELNRQTIEKGLGRSKEGQAEGKEKTAPATATSASALINSALTRKLDQKEDELKLMLQRMKTVNKRLDELLQKEQKRKEMLEESQKLGNETTKKAELGEKEEKRLLKEIEMTQKYLTAALTQEEIKEANKEMMMLFETPKERAKRRRAARKKKTLRQMRDTGVEDNEDLFPTSGDAEHEEDVEEHTEMAEDSDEDVEDEDEVDSELDDFDALSEDSAAEEERDGVSVISIRPSSLPAAEPHVVPPAPFLSLAQRYTYQKKRQEKSSSSSKIAQSQENLLSSLSSSEPSVQHSSGYSEDAAPREMDPFASTEDETKEMERENITLAPSSSTDLMFPSSSSSPSEDMMYGSEEQQPKSSNIESNALHDAVLNPMNATRFFTKIPARLQHEELMSLLFEEAEKVMEELQRTENLKAEEAIKTMKDEVNEQVEASKARMIQSGKDAEERTVEQATGRTDEEQAKIDKIQSVVDESKNTLTKAGEEEEELSRALEDEAVALQSIRDRVKQLYANDVCKDLFDMEKEEPKKDDETADKHSSQTSASSSAFQQIPSTTVLTVQHEIDALQKQMDEAEAEITTQPELASRIIEEATERTVSAMLKDEADALKKARASIQQKFEDSEDLASRQREEGKEGLAGWSDAAEKRVQTLEVILNKKALEVSQSMQKQWSRHNALLAQIESRLRYVEEDSQRKRVSVDQVEEEWNEAERDIHDTLHRELLVQMNQLEKELLMQYKGSAIRA